MTENRTTHTDKILTEAELELVSGGHARHFFVKKIGEGSYTINFSKNDGPMLIKEGQQLPFTLERAQTYLAKMHDKSLNRNDTFDIDFGDISSTERAQLTALIK